MILNNIFLYTNKYVRNLNKVAGREQTSTLISENVAVKGFSQILHASPLASTDLIDLTEVSRILEQLWFNSLKVYVVFCKKFLFHHIEPGFKLLCEERHILYVVWYMVHVPLCMCVCVGATSWWSEESSASAFTIRHPVQSDSHSSVH